MPRLDTHVTAAATGGQNVAFECAFTLTITGSNILTIATTPRPITERKSTPAPRKIWSWALHHTLLIPQLLLHPSEAPVTAVALP